ncbi:MAG: nucleotide exchange factor GrpE [Clostridia bacterium]|nr:nucleotide exchange factor GrpE [Clostridia bacterium]
MSEEIKTENTSVEEPEKKEKKKSKKASELETLKAELESKNDLLIRTAAEFDNFKKRTERERLSVAEYAKAGIIKQLLPILDNIDRAAASDKQSEDYIKGIELIVKQFEALVGNLGIEEVAKVGDTFDPNFHEAVMHIEDEGLGENVIADVLQKGYKLGDTVIRAAMVKVAN